MRILIAEDHPVSRQLLEVKLVNWGFDVIATRDGNEAWKALRMENAPRIAILDCMMPGIDGVELCRRLRQSETGRYLYIIMLTALHREEELIVGMEAGADDYIVKPFRSNELRVRLNAGKRILEMQQQLLEAHASLSKKTMRLQQTSEALNQAFDELKTKQSQLLQREKMASIGQLAAGVAHEINNPLAGILQNLQLIRSRLLQDSPSNRTDAEKAGCELEKLQDYVRYRNIPNMLELIQDAGQRAAAIVQNMLSFSRDDRDQFVLCNMDHIIRRAIDMSRSDFNLSQKYDFLSIIIDFQCEITLPEILGNENQLQQVFLNLLQNSAQAFASSGQMRESPKIIIRTKSEPGWVLIEVSDNGPGMPQEQLMRIFEPFFTTKEVGRGTGLGLSIAFDIIKKHGGELKVASKEGAGTTFSVVLPREKVPEP